MTLVYQFQYLAAFSVQRHFSTHFNPCEKGDAFSPFRFPSKRYRVQYEDQALANCASHAIYDYTNETKELLHVNVRASIAFPIENDRASWTLLGAQ